MSALAPTSIRASREAPAVEETTPEQASKHRGVEAPSVEANTAAGTTSPDRTTCTHCGLGVPAALVQPGSPEQFCCDACRLVYQTIHACGLDQYYAIRERLGAQGRQAAASSGADGFAEFDDPAFTSVYARPAAIAGEDNAGLLRVELLLEGVHCAAC
ncbi:MAG: heavy metal translocating P-type ATPase metal-binding domain-containing protein, partial [Phycisphaerales bacterium]|nr:heavy metal translocating P-type ATPase metal-binding domain-containing protein [Phycisphaerales bacterium]